MMKKLEEQPLGLVGFLQALGVAAYCSLVGLLLMYGSAVFGKQPRFSATVLFLVLFCTSALVCAIITFGYPVFLFWVKKQTREALKLVVYTAGWLVLFTFIFLSCILIARLI
jgi:hypothetical protein